MSAANLLVLGLGNVLCGDDGLGIAAVGLLREHYVVPPRVRLVDGGTLGLSLLGEIAGCERVLMVDAVRAPGPPGSFVRLGGDEVAPAVRERLSVHQVGVADLLDGLRLLGAYPAELVLLGLVPETLELGLGCSPAVTAALPGFVERLAGEIHDFGHGIRRRGEGEIPPLAAGSVPAFFQPSFGNHHDELRHAFRQP